MEPIYRRGSTQSENIHVDSQAQIGRWSRTVSQDDLDLPVVRSLVQPFMRSHSADEIRTMDPVRWSFENLRDATIFRNRSEGDHLALAIRRAIARRAEAQGVIRNELYKSRSLFDSRFVFPLGKLDESIGWQQGFKIRLLWLIRLIEHYFIPLQLGIVVAIIWANVNYANYASIWMDNGQVLSVHFFVNDVFMALFFGVAMVHVTTALMEGGALYPIKKAFTPLLATCGGVVGPACTYLALVALQGNFDTQSQGWAACIATDISVAWLLAVQVFGVGTHPAVQFLLLLAVVDDVIGLVVIAICFPTGPLQPIWILLILGSIGVSLLLRFWGVKLWYFYVFLAGPLAWYGLYAFGVHPSLALCLVVPFIPGRKNLEKFDHDCALIVHLGLFFFALCNAGVVLTQIGLVTLNIALATVFGKTVGIFTFAYLGVRFAGLSLPTGMGNMHLALMAHISGVGLTVALFVIELAFTDPVLRDEAKLGALLTVGVAPVAILLGRVLHVEEKQPNCSNLV